MPSFSVPLSGLNASSTALSTIANNLANLNTIGYKDQQIQFADLFYQNIRIRRGRRSHSAGCGSQGQLATLELYQGDITSTGIATNVAITGNGFFVVQKEGVQSFTRAGNFEVGTEQPARNRRRPAGPRISRRRMASSTPAVG